MKEQGIKGSESVRAFVCNASAVCEVCQAGDYRFKVRQNILTLQLIILCF